MHFGGDPENISMYFTYIFCARFTLTKINLFML